MARAYLGVGTNLGDLAGNLDRAAYALEAHGIRVTAASKRYTTPPVGPPGQPDYLNAALAIETDLAPAELLRVLKAIERDLGRTPGVRWGPRVIDLDILLYGSEVVDTPDLIIPHKELAHRRFALEPLADLAPDVVVPGLGKTVRALLSRSCGESR